MGTTKVTLKEYGDGCYLILANGEQIGDISCFDSDGATRDRNLTFNFNPRFTCAPWFVDTVQSNGSVAHVSLVRALEKKGKKYVVVKGKG